MSGHSRDHDETRDHDHDHDDDLHHHDHGSGHDHEHVAGLRGWVVDIIRPHSHDHADSLDDALMVSNAGTRALAISLAGLLVTAVLQVIVFAISDSVGLLADTIHNFADAFTALPIGLAFVVARRAPTKGISG